MTIRLGSPGTGIPKSTSGWLPTWTRISEKYPGGSKDPLSASEIVFAHIA
jgi:hypothetical protein